MLTRRLHHSLDIVAILSRFPAVRAATFRPDCSFDKQNTKTGWRIKIPYHSQNVSNVPIPLEDAAPLLQEAGWRWGEALAAKEAATPTKLDAVF